MPDRYADAVRARRAELRAERGVLVGSHRSELRSELALSRLAATVAASTALAELAREVRGHIDRADPAALRALPARLVTALEAVAAALHAGWIAELGPGLRRIAGLRALDLGRSWPRLPPSRFVAGPVPSEPARRGLPLLAGAAGGLALWRVIAVSLVLLPLIGLPVLAGRALLPLAGGVAVVGVVVAAGAQRTALQRAAVRRNTEEMLAVARAGLDTDLARRLLEVERLAGAELEAAVARRRASVDAELRELAPEQVRG